MTKQEIRRLAIELIKVLMEMAEVKKCEWIIEAKVLEEFPLTKSKLKEWRYNATLEYRYHWKYSDNTKGPRRGRNLVLYHRGRLNDFIDNI